MKIAGCVRGWKMRKNRAFLCAYKIAVNLFLKRHGFIVESLEGGGGTKFYPFRSTRLIDLFGDTYDQMAVYMSKLIRKDDVVVDAGAYVGEYSMFAAKSAFNGAVFAFEADPMTFPFIQKNAGLNHLKNIVAVNAIILDKACGKLPYIVDQKDHCRSSMWRENIANPQFSKQVFVDAFSLDHYFLNRASVDKIDFVKIDTEGSDALVLFGMKEIINEYHPKILFEYDIDRFHLAGTLIERVIDFLGRYYDKITFIEMHSGATASMSLSKFAERAAGKTIPRFGNLLVE